MRPALAFAALGLAACSAARPDARLTRAELVGTTWLEECPAETITEAFVRLDADGLMAWSYARADALRRDTVHTWAVEDGALLLRWNEGGATSRYRPGPQPGVLRADSSTFCVDRLPTLQQIGEPVSR